ARGVDDLRHVTIGHRHDEDLSVFVTKSDSLAVCRPFWLITHRTAAVGDLLWRLRPILRNQVQLFFTAKVRNESDPPSVGKPRRPFCMSAGGMREMSRWSVLDCLGVSYR